MVQCQSVKFIPHVGNLVKPQGVSCNLREKKRKKEKKIGGVSSQTEYLINPQRLEQTLQEKRSNYSTSFSICLSGYGDREQIEVTHERQQRQQQQEEKAALSSPQYPRI